MKETDKAREGMELGGDVEWGFAVSLDFG